MDSFSSAKIFSYQATNDMNESECILVSDRSQSAKGYMLYGFNYMTFPRKATIK